MPNPTSSFPNSVHTAVDVSTFTATSLGASSTTHTQLEGQQEEELVATQRKLGAGSGVVPSAGALLQGTGPGSTAWTTPNTLPILGSGIAFLASGTGNVIAFLDNNGNLFISGNYLSM